MRISPTRLLVLTALAVGPSAAEDLVQVRDDLRARLAERIAADAEVEPGRDFLLRLEDALHGETVELTLSRRGGKWVRGEWSGLPDHHRIVASDFSGLAIADGRLTGEIDVTWRDLPYEVLDGLRWERTDLGGSPEERTTTIAIDATWSADRRRYRLTLEEGVEGRPIELDILRAGGVWVEPFAATPEWNRGVHEIDVGGLALEGDLLSGEVALVLHPDKWVPEDQKPRAQTFRLQVRIDDGAAAGTHEGEGDLGALAGAVAGRVEVVVAGHLASRESGTTVHSEVTGHTEVDLAAALPDPSGDAPPLAYRDCRVLLLALREYPLSLREARRRIVEGPDDALDLATPAMAADWVRTAAGQTRSPVIGHGAGAPADFGPYGEVIAWGPGGLIDAPAGTWQRPAHWHLAPAFEIEADAPSPPPLPAVLLAGGDTVEDFRVAAEMGEQYQHRSKFPRLIHTGTTALELAEDRKLWFAVRARAAGSLWIDGRRVWRAGGGDAGAARFAVFPVELDAGSHRLVARVRGHLGEARFELAVSPHDPPEPEAPAASAEPPPSRGYRGDGSAVFPEASPPVAWDLETGSNVAWRAEVPGGSGDPVVAGDLAIVTASPNRVHAFALADGVEAWSAAVGPEPDDDGPVTTSPVADGERVYAFFHHGHLACFDLAGEAVFAHDTGLDAGRGLDLPAPVLVDGKCVVLGYTGSREEGRACHAIAYDAASGAEAWRRELPADVRVARALNAKHDSQSFRDGTAWTIAGLAPVILARGEHKVPLLVSPQGHLIDARSGEVLERAARPVALARSAPVIVDGTCYFSTPHGTSALALDLDEHGTVRARTRWISRRFCYQYPPEDALTHRDYWYDAPVVFDGRCYVQRNTWHHWPQHHPKPRTEVTTYDLDSGLPRGRQTKALSEATNPAGNPAAAGGRLYFTDAGDGKYDGTREHGQVAVAMPGDVPLVIADNVCGKLNSTPIAAGDALLLRTRDGLACLRVDGEEGARFQRERIAHYLNDRLPRFPGIAKVATIPAEETDFFAEEGVPVTKLVEGVMPHDWLVLGPGGRADGDPLAAAGGQAGIRPRVGTEVGDLGAFAPLDRDHLRIGYNVVVYWSDRPPKTYSLDVGLLTGKEPSTTWLYTVVTNDRTRTLQAKFKKIGGAKMRLWLAGAPVGEDEVVRLEPGFYPVMLRVDLGRLPPFVKKTVAQVHFDPVEDPAEQVAAWRARVSPYREHLEAIVAELDGTDHAAEAELLLRYLERAEGRE